MYECACGPCLALDLRRLRLQLMALASAQVVKQVDHLERLILVEDAA